MRPPARFLPLRPALIGLLLVAGASGCAATNREPRGATLQYSEDAKKAYDKAMVAFGEHDWESAKALFKEVKRKYGYSRYARLAELRIADADFATEKLAEAIQGYRNFVHDHRTDPDAAYARFRICKGYFEQVSDGGFLLPPMEERDQATILEAYKELLGFMKENPVSPYSREAKYMLTISTARLVRHELYIARYYIARDEFGAAASRAQYALKAYQGSGLEPEVMVLLGETYLRMHKVAEARTVFQQTMTQYPASPFAEDARNFLLELGRQGK